MLAIDDIAEVMRRNRLRWFGHVERRDELCWIKRIGALQVDGDGVKGRHRKRWREASVERIQRSEMRMLRWMTGVSLSERKSNECVRSMLAIDDVAEVMRRNRLRWFGHVERRDELCWIKRIETLQVDGDGVKGRHRKRWREVSVERRYEREGTL